MTLGEAEVDIVRALEQSAAQLIEHEENARAQFAAGPSRK